MYQLVKLLVSYKSKITFYNPTGLADQTDYDISRITLFHIIDLPAHAKIHLLPAGIRIITSPEQGESDPVDGRDGSFGILNAYTRISGALQDHHLHIIFAQLFFICHGLFNGFQTAFFSFHQGLEDINGVMQGTGKPDEKINIM